MTDKSDILVRATERLSPPTVTAVFEPVVSCAVYFLQPHASCVCVCVCVKELLLKLYYVKINQLTVCRWRWISIVSIAEGSVSVIESITGHICFFLSKVAITHSIPQSIVVHLKSSYVWGLWTV